MDLSNTIKITSKQKLISQIQLEILTLLSEQQVDTFTVDCVNWNDAPDSHLEEILPQIEQVKSKYLRMLFRRTTKMSDEFLGQLGMAISLNDNLKGITISLEQVDSVTIEGIRMIGIGIATAQKIEEIAFILRYNEQVNAKCITSISSIIKSKEKLLTTFILDTEYCQVGDESAIQLGEALSNCKKLISLNLGLGYCPISDVGILSLSEGAPYSLKKLSLNLTGCDRITDEGIVALCKAVSQSQLEEVNISIGQNEQITNKGIKQIINISSIKLVLQIQSLPLITAKIIKYLSTEKVHCKEIFLKIWRCSGVDQSELKSNINSCLAKQIKLTIDLRHQIINGSQDKLFEQISTEKQNITVILSEQKNKKEQKSNMNSQNNQIVFLNDNFQVHSVTESLRNGNHLYLSLQKEKGENESGEGSSKLLLSSTLISIPSDIYLLTSLTSEQVIISLQLPSNTLLQNASKCLKMGYIPKHIHTLLLESIPISATSNEIPNDYQQTIEGGEEEFYSLGEFLRCVGETTTTKQIEICLKSGRIQDSTLNTISKAIIQYPQIKEWKFTFPACQEIQDESFQDIIDTIKKSQVSTFQMCLKGCQQLTDFSLQALTKLIESASKAKGESHIKKLIFEFQNSLEISDTSLFNLSDTIRKIMSPFIYLDIKILDCPKPSIRALVRVDQAIKKNNSNISSK